MAHDRKENLEQDWLSTERGADNGGRPADECLVRTSVNAPGPTRRLLALDGGEGTGVSRRRFIWNLAAGAVPALLLTGRDSPGRAIDRIFSQSAEEAVITLDAILVTYASSPGGSAGGSV